MINFAKLCSRCNIKILYFSQHLHFLLYSMAFISGTQRDTVRPLVLARFKFGHILLLTCTGPSNSSASEVISIFCTMSFRRLCCFSSMLDNSFILRGKTLCLCQWSASIKTEYIYDQGGTANFIPCDNYGKKYKSHLSVSFISLTPLGVAHASETTVRFLSRS